MFSITEQFSAVTKSQLEAQFNIFNSIASKAMESAQKVLALNLSTTKATVEKSSATARLLMAAKDPKEFFSVSAQAPNFDNMLAYSRQLLSIASSAQAELLQSARERVQDAAPATAPAAATAAAAVNKLVTPPVIAVSTDSANEAIAAPPAAPKAAAKAIAKAKPATPSKPVAAALAQLAETPVVDKPAAAPIITPVAVALPKVATPASTSIAVTKPAASKAPAKVAAKPGAVSFPSAKSVMLKSVKPAPKSLQGKQLDMLGGAKTKK